VYVSNELDEEDGSVRLGQVNISNQDKRVSGTLVIDIYRIVPEDKRMCGRRTSFNCANCVSAGLDGVSGPHCSPEWTKALFGTSQETKRPFGSD
jgi:hypothetical protein